MPLVDVPAAIVGFAELPNRLKTGRSAYDLAGEVFDAFACRDSGNVDFDAQPGCRHVEAASVWVQDFDNQGRARVKLEGEDKYVLASRLLIDCKGVDASVRSFWNPQQERYDFRGCD